MTKTTIIEQIQIDGTIVEIVEIDHGNEQFTSMLKSVYDEQQAQAEHFTPMVTDDPKP